MEMIIDGWDIAEIGAELRRFKDLHHEISNNSEWNTGSKRPVFLPSDIGWKNINVELMVRGDGYDDISDKIGLIMSKLLNKSTIKFKGHKNNYDLILKSTPKPDEKVKESWHILPLEFIGIEYGDEITLTLNQSKEFVVDNIGTYDSPVTIYITPTIYTIIGDQVSDDTAMIVGADGTALIDGSDSSVLVSYSRQYDGMKISGISYDPVTGEDVDITINNFTIGSTIKIDGNTGVISEGGQSKIEDVDIWTLPSLKPGRNVIRTNGDFMNVVVKYNPRYM